jgi:hypothetical protein
MNIYNRIFDDQNQMRIRFETMAIDILFELIEKSEYELSWSFILEDENKHNPFITRKDYIKLLSSICSETIEPCENIREIATEIMNNSSCKSKDALHFASAVYSGCSYFITCDNILEKTLNKNKTKIDFINGIKIFNPVDFLREEMKINVIE